MPHDLENYVVSQIQGENLQIPTLSNNFPYIFNQ